MGGGHAPLTIEPSLSSHFSMKVRRRLDIGATRDRHETLARRSSILQVYDRQQAKGPRQRIARSACIGVAWPGVKHGGWR